MEENYTDMLTSVKSLLSKSTSYIDRFNFKTEAEKDIKTKLDLLINDALAICLKELKEDNLVTKRYIEFNISDNSDETLTTCLFINSNSSTKNLMSVFSDFIRFYESPNDCLDKYCKKIIIRIGTGPNEYVSGGIGIYTKLSSEELLKKLFVFCEEHLNKTYLNNEGENQ